MQENICQFWKWKCRNKIYVGLLNIDEILWVSLYNLQDSQY